MYTNILISLAVLPALFFLPSFATATERGDANLYSFTGAYQYFSIPSCASSFEVHLWGAGGSSCCNNACGGAGAYVNGTLRLVTGTNANTTLRVIVGKGGVWQGNPGENSADSFGGGGDGYYKAPGYVGSGGGGRSAIQAYVPLPNGTLVWTELVTAGGGGGASPAAGDCTQAGGAGSWNGIGHRGGDQVQTTTAKGALCGGGGLIRGGACLNSGSLFHGGDASTADCCSYFGGGGGGYYGGGGGGIGGGGSSLITYLSSPGGEDAPTSAPYTSVGRSSPYWLSTSGASGQHGRVAIVPLCVASPSPIPLPSSSSTVTGTSVSSSVTPAPSVIPFPIYSASTSLATISSIMSFNRTSGEVRSVLHNAEYFTRGSVLDGNDFRYVWTEFSVNSTSRSRNQQVLSRIDPSSGTITTFISYEGLRYATNIAVDMDGNMFVVSNEYANVGTFFFSFSPRYFIAVQKTTPGIMYILDSVNNAINVVDMVSGDISTRVSTNLSSPAGIAVDEDGNVYVSDTGNNVVRKFAQFAGSMSTVIAETGQLNRPMGIAVDNQRNLLYVADSGNNAIQRFDLATGVQTAIVWNGLQNPMGVAVDEETGNVFISDTGNHVIKRYVMSSRKVEIVVDGSKLHTPTGLAFREVERSLYITDTGDMSIKQYDGRIGEVRTLVESPSL